jgi:hypothetical protein
MSETQVRVCPSCLAEHVVPKRKRYVDCGCGLTLWGVKYVSELPAKPETEAERAVNTLLAGGRRPALVRR